MFVEIFVWSWINLHPIHLLKKSAVLLGLAALVLLPLIYVNIDLIKKGFRPASPSFNIEVNDPQQYPDR
jgi:hypothetical protein